MPLVSTRLSKVGFAKQTAKGTPAALPLYGFGVLDGEVFNIDIDQPDEDITTDRRVVAGANRLKAVPGADFTTRCYPKSLGLLLFAAMGTKVTVPGTPNVHTMTIADLLDVYLTMWSRLGAEYTKTQDVKIDSLGISWEEAGPLELSVTVMGTKLFLGEAAWTATTPELDAGGKFRAAGGTFKLSVDSAVPATARVTGGEITIDNSAEPVILSDSITPDDVDTPMGAVTCKLTLKPYDLTDWRKAVTGSAAGITISDLPIYGSFETKFIKDASTDLVLSAPRVGFMADFPGADPSGKAVELELDGGVYEPAAGQAFTAVLRNDVAAY